MTTVDVFTLEVEKQDRNLLRLFLTAIDQVCQQQKIPYGATGQEALLSLLAEDGLSDLFGSLTVKTSYRDEVLTALYRAVVTEVEELWGYWKGTVESGLEVFKEDDPVYLLQLYFQWMDLLPLISKNVLTGLVTPKRETHFREDGSHLVRDVPVQWFEDEDGVQRVKEYCNHLFRTNPFTQDLEVPISKYHTLVDEIFSNLRDY